MRRSLQILSSVLAALAAAELAFVALRPGTVGPAALTVDPRAYFSQTQLNKAEDFTTDITTLFFLGVGINFLFLVSFVVLARRRQGAESKHPKRRAS